MWIGGANHPLDSRHQQRVRIDGVRMVDSNLIEDLAEHLQILGDAARANRVSRVS